MDFFKKKLLFKMLVKYYLSDNIKALYEDFALDLGNVWTSPVSQIIIIIIIGKSTNYIIG